MNLYQNLKINKEQLEQLIISNLKDLNGYPEEQHAKADDILCDFLKILGFEKVVEEYEKIEKWYS